MIPPLIGIPCRSWQHPKNSRLIYGSYQTCVHALEDAGGIPVLIPLLSDLSGLTSLLARLDGLLLSGGSDIQPRLYSEDPHPMLGPVDPRLDEFELALVQWAIEKGLPTLGICRGMQILNVALGGSLYQDLTTMYPGSLRHANWDLPRNQIVHRVSVKAGSRMEEILGVRELNANSLHHQGVKVLGRGVCITGYAEDGVAELMEIPEQRFMMAVACHPEYLYQDEPVWARLFAAFVGACSMTIM
ncbi:MAG: gamma-glutamyl-gamma-aminobutyrate hydrolase family protein [Chloroflexi bacterium]|nr:gamma-glutamyl-gamma-aminobutyrate hydrolase family protein [Ktedonobacteraceae bacterium]MBV8821694.1 gamma-glutamyl-gamma-aminobutyrate hydrolase family protein [Ktedonobacteraceae bacterium]MBV9021645.1 gamma-glutamyl-gamma-aminobutyrate hydrolase family protein [Ktedonobacteraceae bacterium]MBV9706532.1 gamma-glutamyl-gamma-aminobutyrate hydrolase family protein [Chloroflexota bacterium]